MLKLCETNGGAFIKVGQHLGALDYLLPFEYVSTMKVLHSQAPQSSFEDVLNVIKEDLKCEVCTALTAEFELAIILNSIFLPSPQQSSKLLKKLQ